MHRFVKEPLLHFALIGAALFAAYAWLNDERSPHNPSNVIHVTNIDRDWLSEMWVRQWRRPPGENELQDLLVAHVKEQLLYREARALKLDDQDVVVRRRLAQKMDFLLEDEVAPEEPSEAELQGLYREQLEHFRTEPRVSFVHVYYSRDRRGAVARMDAQHALDEWRRSQRSPVGDLWVLDDRIEGQDRRSVSEQFGEDFAEKIFTLSNDQWSGPVESAYGAYLVRIDRRDEGEVRPFADVRADLIAEHRRLSRDSISNSARRLSVRIAASFSSTLTRLMGRLERGEPLFNAHHQSGGSLARHFPHASSLLLSALIVASTVIGASTGSHIEGVPRLGIIGFFVAGALGVGGAVIAFKSGRR